MPEGANWTVREAGADDASALALVGGATFLETFAGVLAGHAILEHCARTNSADAYARYLAQGSRAWLAEMAPGAVPIGLALVTAPDISAARDGDIELKRIYALSRFHGSGIGAALLRAAIDAAAGFERLLLGVYAGNQRAIAFYRKNGFEPIAERKFDVGGTLYDDIVLARPLAA
ncbi:MAG: GNAT family N-acetyltransferase [Sphingomonas sp.]|uniref:GNAT family N-acetyltransferase n=1 Tax=Sphingomonas sp. TaxID=28214 RepID=UPI001B1752C6|nr:N-acetyltransferase [Sphingomonas sp.]MBO9624447.1 GNAT family N-acetyltransferase [Sphingomonas sp.]